MRPILLAVLIYLACCEEDYGCLDACECDNISEYTINDAFLFYTEEAGCVRNVTCLNSPDSHIALDFQGSEIPRPLAPTWKPYRPETYLMPPNATPGSTPTGIDIFSFFGIICENSTWYITKYPNGYSYQVKVDETTNRIEYVAPDSTIDGKKSPLFHMYCPPWPLTC
ncbi:DUF281 domain-containing protein [Caenorhabditis elegans]|uniref:DUF281 domain-containing protein n=1 Tax=Caenorhabditis elegans TaxID=6239 RepID=Q9TZF6_CAEEL|nr:DUF281 domain-containing protein [Caenorhabditis elegans]CCD73607.1 DUF281 domain-containing protein [Caenorhabditis elegans]|eukprot:NP_494451.2 Uncharacterized protein CELE_T10D4.7 [Caenorhabditis elegans]